MDRAMICRKNGCGDEWERDPAQEVACPECPSTVGHQCTTLAPSGHRKGAQFGQVKNGCHDGRDLAAAMTGFYCHPCSGEHGLCNCSESTHNGGSRP